MAEQLVDQKGVMAALIVLRQIVPGQHPDISEGTASIWYAHLAGFTTNDVMAAAMDYTGDRFPSRNEFVDCVRATRRIAREGQAALAEMANTEGTDNRCPHCLGYGWELLTTAPTWTVRACPKGCEPPLPPHQRALAAHAARKERKAAGGDPGPQRVPSDVIDVTSRITGDF